MWSPEENWNELRTRLEDAHRTLTEMADAHADPNRQAWLAGKANGCSLALSYMAEADRAGPGVVA